MAILNESPLLLWEGTSVVRDVFYAFAATVTFFVGFLPKVIEGFCTTLIYFDR